MKYLIISLLLVITTLLCNAQIIFDGFAIPVHEINTQYGQSFLTINHQRKTLAFSEERFSLEMDKSIEIQTVEIEDNPWIIWHLTDFLNEKGMISPIGFDKSGGLYFNEVIYEKGIYIGAVKYLSPWQVKPKNVNIAFLKSRTPLQSGHLSKNENYMILSLERNDGYGVEDLYVIEKMGLNKWSTPKNLGYMINTKFQEITPFLHSDNHTLFFSTNGRGGEGSMDIFYAIRQDESWRKWSDPMPIAQGVNSSAAENSFSFTNNFDWAYFIRSENSDSYGDIYKIKIKNITENKVSEDSALSLTDLLLTAKKSIINTLPKKTIDISIINHTNQLPVSGNIFFEDQPILKNKDRFFLPDSFLMKEITIQASKYLTKKITLDSSFLSKDRSIISLYPLEVGSTIHLENVLFYRGTAKMIEKSKIDLDIVVNMMKSNKEMVILLKGHTDNRGNEILNLLLSEGRVKNIKNYLTEQGVSSNRIQGKGYGGSKPIADNQSEETRKLNRRVEFEIIKVD